MKLQLIAVCVAPLFLSSLPGCSDGGAADRQGRIEDSSAGTVALGIGPARYREAALPASATLTGALTAQAAVGDSVATVGADSAACGDSAVVAAGAPAGGAVSRALVWIDGIAAGKALPEKRRETITLERCAFQPRITAVVSGTTINLFASDRAVHGVRFYREGSGPIAEVHTVDAGQVVPSEKIASGPGMVEARCAKHPWARSYVAVFDHPYFAITDDTGRFTMDALPPGTYTVKVWHERLPKPAEQRVVVAPGGAARMDLALALR